MEEVYLNYTSFLHFQAILSKQGSHSHGKSWNLKMYFLGLEQSWNFEIIAREKVLEFQYFWLFIDV